MSHPSTSTQTANADSCASSPQGSDLEALGTSSQDGLERRGMRCINRIETRGPVDARRVKNITDEPEDQYESAQMSDLSTAEPANDVVFLNRSARTNEFTATTESYDGIGDPIPRNEGGISELDDTCLAREDNDCLMGELDEINALSLTLGSQSLNNTACNEETVDTDVAFDDSQSIIEDESQDITNVFAAQDRGFQSLSDYSLQIRASNLLGRPQVRLPSVAMALEGADTLTSTEEITAQAGEDELAMMELRSPALMRHLQIFGLPSQKTLLDWRLEYRGKNTSAERKPRKWAKLCRERCFARAKEKARRARDEQFWRRWAPVERQSSLIKQLVLDPAVEVVET